MTKREFLENLCGALLLTVTVFGCFIAIMMIA